MKNVLNLFLLAFSTLMLSSCFPKPEYLTADPIEFSSEGGEKGFEDDRITYYSFSIIDDKGNKSVYKYSQSNHSRIDIDTLDWLNLEQYSNYTDPYTSTLTVTAEKNDTGKERTLYISADFYGPTHIICTIPVIQSK